MRKSPFESPRTLVRILAKAIALLLILNVVCLALDFDPVAALTTINVSGGRERLMYPSFYQNGQLPIESNVRAHRIAYTPKSPDEYRVVLLGDSGVAGWSLTDAQTLSTQLNRMNVVIDGKRLVVYNLAYPYPSVAREVLILESVLKYEPDLIIWFIKPFSLDYTSDTAGGNSALRLDRRRLDRIAERDPALRRWFDSYLPPEDPLTRYIALRNPATLSIWFNSLIYPIVPEPAPRPFAKEITKLLPAQAQFRVDNSPAMPNDAWAFMRVGYDIATENGVPLLFINGSIFIGSGQHSDVNYNKIYQRAYYDTYRSALTEYLSAYPFVDMWDVIPPEEFNDAPDHPSEAGWGIVAQRLVEILQEMDFS
jgi:hypothetical protein